MKCKKIAYHSKKSAVKALNEIKSSPKYQTKDKKELRTYKCLDCGMFHLTSMPKRFYQSPEQMVKNQTDQRIAAIADHWRHRLGLRDD